MNTMYLFSVVTKRRDILHARRSYPCIQNSYINDTFFLFALCQAGKICNKEITHERLKFPLHIYITKATSSRCMWLTNLIMFHKREDLPPLDYLLFFLGSAHVHFRSQYISKSKSECQRKCEARST